MATEKDLTLDQDNLEAEAGGSKKKLIIIILLVVILIAIAIGATVFLMTGDEEVEEAAEAAVVEEVVLPVQYIKMKPRFIVNYNVGTRQRFLQVSIEIMTRSPEVTSAIELHNPMLRNEIIRILSAQDFTALRLPEGRLALKNQLHEQLAATLKSEADVEGIEAVLFTDFVMQ